MPWVMPWGVPWVIPWVMPWVMAGVLIHAMGKWVLPRQYRVLPPWGETSSCVAFHLVFVACPGGGWLMCTHFVYSLSLKKSLKCIKKANRMWNVKTLIKFKLIDGSAHSCAHSWQWPSMECLGSRLGHPHFARRQPLLPNLSSTLPIFSPTTHQRSADWWKEEKQQ